MGQVMMRELIGRVVGKRYQLTKIVGRGGFATVFMAKDLKLFGQTVAVKILHEPTEDSERSSDRREVEVAVECGGENIVKMEDYGYLNGHFYLVMEFIDGPTLDELVSCVGRGLPWQRSIPYLIQLADALGSAHDRGVIHRDLKPSNCMIGRGENGDQLKLVDLGIAKRLSPPTTVKTVSFGTPMYMAPEMFLGADYDHRVDIYAFGLVMFEVLVGRPPFRCGDEYSADQACGWYAHHHVNVKPPTPSSLATDKLFPRLLDHIILRALAKDPEQRYQSVHEVKVDLERVLSIRPSQIQTSPFLRAIADNSDSSRKKADSRVREPSSHPAVNDDATKRKTGETSRLTSAATKVRAPQLPRVPTRDADDVPKQRHRPAQTPSKASSYGRKPCPQPDSAPPESAKIRDSTSRSRTTLKSDEWRWLSHELIRERRTRQIPRSLLVLTSLSALMTITICVALGAALSAPPTESGSRSMTYVTDEAGESQAGLTAKTTQKPTATREK